MSKSRYQRESENEDDPDPYQSSGEEWDFEKAKREESGRRKSARLSRRPRKKLEESDGTTSEEDTKNRKRNGSTKKRKIKEDSSESDTTPIKKEREDDQSPIPKEEGSPKLEPKPKPKQLENSETNTTTPVMSRTYSRPISRKYIPKTIFSEDYATGSFVILKTDARGGDVKNHPCIWRIDGKALLQKYEAFDEDNKVRHKNTSVYTGWSPLDKDLYAPVTVDVIKHVNSNLIVELHWDKLQAINIDSD